MAVAIPWQPALVTLDRSVRQRCNIGPAEIARRRRSATVLSLLAAAVAVALVALDVSTAARLAIFPFATAAAVTWLQVVHKFCVAFAALGIENFGAIGEERPAEAAMRALDRRRLAQLVLEGSAIGAAVTLVFVVAPV
jgi:hypothetical protein